MAKLPRSFRESNRTTEAFRRQYSKLPPRIQDLTRKGCLLFHADPSAKSLRRHELHDTSKGSHQPKSFSVSITLAYRAIYFVDSVGVNVWYWIGTHAAYDVFTGNV